MVLQFMSMVIFVLKAPLNNIASHPLYVVTVIPDVHWLPVLHLYFLCTLHRDYESEST